MVIGFRVKVFGFRVKGSIHLMYVASEGSGFRE